MRPPGAYTTADTFDRLSAANTGFPDVLAMFTRMASARVPPVPPSTACDRILTRFATPIWQAAAHRSCPRGLTLIDLKTYVPPARTSTPRGATRTSPYAPAGIGDVLPPLGIRMAVVPATTWTGGSCEAFTTGRVTAWQVVVDTAPCSSRQKSESGRAFLRSLMVRPTTAPATRTFLPTVAVPLLEPTSPSTARTSFCSVRLPSAKSAYAKGESGGPPRCACAGADRAAHPTRTAAIVVRFIIAILLRPSRRRPSGRRHGATRSSSSHRARRGQAALLPPGAEELRAGHASRGRRRSMWRSSVRSRRLRRR